jgi:hypothetical protein
MGKPKAGLEAQKAEQRACPMEKRKAAEGTRLEKLNGCLDGKSEGFRLECPED